MILQDFLIIIQTLSESYFMKKQSKLFIFIIIIISKYFLMPTNSIGEMISSHYSILLFQENCGSGFRSSSKFNILSDIVGVQLSGSSSSTNYTLISGRATFQNANRIDSCIYINKNEELTNSVPVTLSLICSHPSGCPEVSISNNGVSWSNPEPFSTYINWTLTPNDGKRTVFAKFKSGDGDWSGVCSDSIILDTKAPKTTISPIGGTFMEDPAVALTASEPSTIYYTIDGANPTTDSEVYADPITFSSDSIVKCFAVDKAGNVGSISMQDYTVCSGSDMSISGTVVDATVNKGMPMAVITLNTGHTATTDVNGNYSFSSLSKGYYTVESITTVSSGYVAYQKELMLCHNSIDHNISLTKKAALFGGDTFSGYSLDSVNTGTGNYVCGATDLAIPGRGFSFVFERSYNSQDTTDGPLGYNWTHNYNISLSEDGDGNVTVRWGDGKAETWTLGESEKYTPMKGVFNTLIKNTDNTFTVRQKDLIQYNFNLSNQLASIEDENGNALTFTYDAGNIEAITDAAGRRVEISYDGNNRITRILDSIGRSVTFAYDVNGDLISSTDLGGNTTAYSYDSDHQILTVTDPLGNIVATNTYDEQRRVISSQRDALGAETLYSYDTVNKVTQIVDPYGNTSYHYFDDLLRLIQEEDAKGNSAYYVFNEQGSTESATDKNGNVTTYVYDEAGNVLTKTDPLGHETTATYDANNNPLTKTDANGNMATYTYDAYGNLETVTDPLGNTTAYTYDAYGQMLTKTDAQGNVTAYEYDLYGNRVAVEDALGNLSTFTYDIVGRKLTESHPIGRSTAYEYDDMDNLISVTNALGHVSSYTYDANGNKTEHIDAKANKIVFAYDAKNRLISKTNPLGDTEHYQYDSMDRRTAVTNYNGATSTVVYDSLGNIVNEIDALGNHVQYRYDANGNKTRVTDAMGNSTLFAYDAMNRLISTTDPLGNVVTNTYDSNDNLLTVTDQFGHTITNTYDAMNHLETITDHLGNSVINDYDELGRLKAVTDARGNQTAYDYDEVGRTVKVTDAENGEVTATYDAIGNRLSLTDTRGYSTTYTYDVLNRLTSETDPLGNSETMTYDSLGNTTTFSNADGTRQYSYDKNSRLTDITYPDSTTVSYTYDANGNRLIVTDTSGQTLYAYDLRDQVSSITDPFGMTVGYTYNPNGKRTSIKYPGNRTVTYLFDSLNRLLSVQDWGGVTTSYQYDDAGRLIGKTMGNGSKVTYTYDDADRLIGKVDQTSDGSTIAGYTYTLDENGNRTGMNINQPLLPRIDYVDQTFTYNEGNQLISDGEATYTYDDKGNRIARDNGLATEVTRDGLVAEYLFDEGNASDTSGYGNHGTAIGGGVNFVDNAASFDGVSSYISVSGSPELDTQEYTVSAWFKSNSLGNSIVAHGESFSGDIMQHSLYARNTNMCWYEDSGPETPGNDHRLSAVTPIENGNWYFIAVTLDSDLTYKLYVNGNLESSRIESAGPPSIGNHILTIGARTNSPDIIQDYFSGIIDSVRVYNRALSEGEIQCLYGGEERYAYNYQNRLTKVSKCGNVDEYSYSTNGNRLSSIHNGIETRYLLDLNTGMENILAEMDENNNINKFYVYGDGLLYSVDAINGERLYYHYDPIGSTVALADLNEDVTDKYAYLPFGEMNVSETTHDNPFTFVGKYGVMLEGNGLYFMRARYYDPATRSFLREDPIKGSIMKTQTLNPYIYVHNNPVILIDPKGEVIETILFVAFSAAIVNELAYVAEEPDMERRNNRDRVCGAPKRLAIPIVGTVAGLTGAGGIVATIAGLIDFSNTVSGSYETGDTKLDYQQNYNNYDMTPVMHAADYSTTRNDTVAAMNAADSINQSLYSGYKYKKKKLNSTKEIIGEQQNLKQASENQSEASRPPKQYLDVAHYAGRYFSREFAKLKDPNFANSQTRSYIEYRIQREMSNLQTKRYGYRTSEQKDRARAYLNTAIRQSAKRLYAGLTRELSKYHVLIRDLDQLPDFNSGNVNRRGVYAN